LEKAVQRGTKKQCRKRQAAEQITLTRIEDKKSRNRGGKEEQNRLNFGQERRNYLSLLAAGGRQWSPPAASSILGGGAGWRRAFLLLKINFS
jgi:hypothetical protein